MARPLRIQYPNAHYHVTCRGNAREAIFVTRKDYTTFLDLLARSSEIYQVVVLAYVLMPNHFHLVLRTPRGNLNEFMRHFNISYTGCFNKVHQRVGHLYQGRYKAFLIDADSYLLEVSRYVHLNPVRARSAARLSVDEKKHQLASYHWSSYPAYGSPGKRLSFLSVELLDTFRGDTPSGRAAYRRFVEAGIAGKLENPLEKARGSGIIGDKPFIDKLKQRMKPVSSREMPQARKLLDRVDPERIISLVATHAKVSSDALVTPHARIPARALLMELLYRYAGLNQPEIGRLLGIDYTGVSVARSRLVRLLEKDKQLKKITERLRKELSEE
jgi:putative transposase